MFIKTFKEPCGVFREIALHKGKREALLYLEPPILLEL